MLRYHTTEVRRRPAARRRPFLACSFWLADNLALQGRLDEAHALFERLVASATMSACSPRNTITVAKRLVGNFPQAFSHVALVNTGMNLMSHEQDMAQQPGNRRITALEPRT